MFCAEFTPRVLPDLMYYYITFLALKEVADHNLSGKYINRPIFGGHWFTTGWKSSRMKLVILDYYRGILQLCTLLQTIITAIEASSIDRIHQGKVHLMTREEPSLETLWLQNTETMYKSK
jgi:hypothetical protein